MMSFVKNVASGNSSKASKNFAQCYQNFFHDAYFHDIKIPWRKIHIYSDIHTYVYIYTVIVTTSHARQG